MRAPSLGRRLRLVVAALVFLVVAIPAAVAAQLPVDRYEATATVGVRPDATATGSWQLVSFLLPSVQADVISQGSRDQAVRALGDELPATASWSVATAVEPGTGVLQITVSSEDARVVAPLGNAFATTLVSSYATDPALDLRLIDPAAPPTTPAGPDRLLITASGVTLGLLLGGLVLLLAPRRPSPATHRARPDEALAADLGTSSTAPSPPTAQGHPDSRPTVGHLAAHSQGRSA